MLDGDPALPPQKGAEPPNFRPMFIVAKRLDGSMALGMEVGLGPGHIVLHGDQAPSKGGTASHFSAHVYYGQTVAHLSYC